ncbi:MAG: RhuM family protein [bacterium]
MVRIYSLDVIISVGYMVNSKCATHFRIWVTSILKKYLIDGYAINEKRLFGLTKLSKYYKMQVNMNNILNTINLVTTKVKACIMFGSFFGFKNTVQGSFGSNSC